MKLLVTYASAAGSTRGVAERIAARLAERGHQVACLPVTERPDAAEFDAVVVGSAVHGQQWLPSATDWLGAHRATLRTRPVWAFSVGMPAALGRPFRRLGTAEASKIEAALAQDVPLRAHRLFSGVVTEGTFRGRSRWAFRLMGCRYGDFRDWSAIDRYADQIAEELARSESRSFPAE